jgi:hypothetical protein
MVQVMGWRTAGCWLRQAVTKIDDHRLGARIHPLSAWHIGQRSGGADRKTP